MIRAISFIGKLLFILVLLGLLFSFAMFQGGFVSWFLFFGFLPILLYHLGLLFYPIHEWQINRRLSKHIVRSGEGITVTINMKRKIAYPLYYCVFEELVPESLNKWDIRPDKYLQMGHPGHLTGNRTMKRMVFPGWKRHVTITYPLDGLPRGEHAFNRIRVTTGDLFGFVHKTAIFSVPDQLVVQPNSLPIEMEKFKTSFDQGSITSNAWNLKNTNIATGIREYLPGDKFSWIDWKQTARKNTVMTKEFDREKSSDTFIILDSCSRADFYELAFETTIELSLSIMENVKKQASNSRFLTITGTMRYFDVHQNPNEADRLRRHLTRLKPNGSVPFSMMLRKAAQQMSNASRVILITTQLDDALKDRLKQLRKRSKQVVVHLVQPADSITDQKRTLFQKLRFNGIDLNVLTEEQFTQHMNRGEGR